MGTGPASASSTSRRPGPARLLRSPSNGTVEDSYSAHFHLSRLGRQPDGARPFEGLRMSQAFTHHPAMVAEVVDLFEPVEAGLVVDATVGGGGHAEAILAAHPQLRVLGLDRDPDAVEAASTRLARWGDRARVVHARFDVLAGLGTAPATDAGGLGATDLTDLSKLADLSELTHLADPAGEPLVGLLFDLGVSSAQIDRAERGFSYRTPGPLDMRMDPSQGPTAADLVNTMAQSDLVSLLVANGDGRWARAIARSIVGARPLTTTSELAEAVARAIPAPARRRGHPATRVFQALRIEVNGELALLASALEPAVAALRPGGRAVVLSYHSGEDRLVKAVFARAATGGCTCPPGLPCVCGARPWARLLNRGARLPSREEVAANPRSAATRLRAVQRLDAETRLPETRLPEAPR